MADGRDPGAAAVADRLKAFAADPSADARRFLSGIEPLPPGHFVLRFAQGRFPAGLGLAPPAERELRAAAELFVRRVCLSDRADHYHVLCAPRDASYEAIKENYHLLMALLHPDRREHAACPWPEAGAQLVNLAYATLGDEAKRREYDVLIRGAAAARGRRERGLRTARPHVKEVRFATTLLVVSAVVAALLVASLLVEDAEWRDRSVLQAALARLGAHPVPGSERPRYVGVTAMAQPQRASDAGAAEESEPFAFLRPILRVLTPESPKRALPVPKLEAIPVAAAAPLKPPMPDAPPPHATQTQAVVMTQVAQAAPQSSSEGAAPVASGPANPSKAASLAIDDSVRPTNQDVETLVVALVSYYEAGDADRLVGLVEAGYWRTERMRQTYADFFRATRMRSLRVERLTWNRQAGAAKAKGEATMIAEYYGESAPVQRRLDLELDVAMREGRARITRLALYPER